MVRARWSGRGGQVGRVAMARRARIKKDRLECKVDQEKLVQVKSHRDSIYFLLY